MKRSNHIPIIKILRGVNFAAIILLFGPMVQAQKGCTDHWETLVREDDSWKYAVDSVFEHKQWRLINYNDSGWSEGPGGIGYGDGDDATIIPSCKILYLRRSFTILDTSQICKALLSIDYDDGFVAFLNGGEIARSGVSGPDPDATSEVALREAIMRSGGHPENFNVPADTLKKYLLEGENLLSLQIHNQSTSSSDLSSRVFLSLGLSISEQAYGPLAQEIIVPVSFDDGFDIPLVSIETDGATIPRSGKITARMRIVDNGNGLRNYASDSGNVYTGYIGIKIRGSSSSGFPQKSYTLETRDSEGENRNIPLLGMPEENDWLLISNYYDRSFMRNFLSHEIFTGMGHYSPRVRHCEVLLNGDYKGVYLLVEKIKVDKNRIDIAKLRDYENSGDDVTGGYIIKNDNYAQDGSNSWQLSFPMIEELDWSAVDARFVYEYPDWDVITPEQKTYIQQFIESSKQVLYGSSFKDPLNGYRAYFDVPSFVDYLIISEVSRNGDSYKKSRFFHKDKESKGGLFNAGPPWDFDWAWKNLFFQSSDGSGWVHSYEAYGYSDVQPVRYMNQMLQDEYFSNETYERYYSLRQSVLHYDTLVRKIDSIANYLSEAQVRNFAQWDILNDQSGDPDSHVPNSYLDEVQYLKGWIFERLSWLDDNMVKFQRDQTNSSTPEVQLFFRVFPNPASRQVYIESNEPIGEVLLFTMEGTMLQRVSTDGSRSYELNLEQLNPGIYLIRITINGITHTRKIIKS